MLITAKIVHQFVKDFKEKEVSIRQIFLSTQYPFGYCVPWQSADTVKASRPPAPVQVVMPYSYPSLLRPFDPIYALQPHDGYRHSRNLG